MEYSSNRRGGVNSVDNANQLIYVSNAAGLVGIYDASGNLLGTSGGPGNGYCDAEGIAAVTEVGMSPTFAITQFTS